MFLALVLMVVVVLLLHPLDDLLLAGGVSYDLEHADAPHVFVCGIGKRVLDPFVRLTAHVHEQVAVRYDRDVLHRGLIAVQVDPIVEKVHEVEVLGLVAQDLSRPVICGKGGADDGGHIA